MKVLYTNQSLWELDYFKELFPSSEFQFYDDLELPEHNNGTWSLVVNSRTPLKSVISFCKKYQPVYIFLLSDESGDSPDWYVLKKYCTTLFRQYNHTNYPNELTVQLPLGYVTGMLNGKSSLVPQPKWSDRKFDFSFVGAIKSDRVEMLNVFSDTFKNKYVKTGMTNWGDTTKQNVSPAEMYSVYQNTKFVPVGRGNWKIDCFRMYEVILSGAVPVLVADRSEINNSLWYAGDIPPIITADNWADAASICKNINEQAFNNYQQSLLEWWSRQMTKIKTIISGNINVPKFVINLKRRPDRLKLFQDNCPWPVETVNAFDGKNEHLENKKDRKVYSSFNRIRPGERGCFISHLKIWKMIVDKNLPMAMVFEDDAEFSDHFNQKMEHVLSNLPEDLTLLYFGGRFEKDFKVPSEYTLPVTLTEPVTVPDKPVNKYINQNNFSKFYNVVHDRTTHAYIISNKTAKLFIEIFNNVPKNQQLDHFMVYKLRALEIPIYNSIPLLCWSPMVGDSDIR